MASSNQRNFSRVQGSWASNKNSSSVIAPPSVSSIKKSSQKQTTELTYQDDKSV